MTDRERELEGAMKLTAAQKRAVDQWRKRTMAGEWYHIPDVFSGHNPDDNGMRRSMHVLADRGLLVICDESRPKGTYPRVAGGNPLKETT